MQCADPSATANMVQVGLINRPRGAGCAGVLSFERGSWQQHLAGRCVMDLAFAADGSVWAATGEDDDGDDPDGAGLYVITLEAMAEAE